MVVKSKNFCIVLSSPSGAGKTSISKKLLQKDRSISLSISCTTRRKRIGEINKKDYIFISEDNFHKKIKNNEFLEHASVFGHNYGTLTKTVKNSLKKTKMYYLILIGKVSPVKQSGFDVVGIFILPPKKKN